MESTLRLDLWEPCWCLLSLFTFQLCGYSTPDNSRLKNHILSVHQGIMPYNCDLCDYKCNEKSDISELMKAQRNNDHNWFSCGQFTS